MCTDRVYIINIYIFSCRKYFTRSLRTLVKYFSTLKEKFRISARPCNILYIMDNVYKGFVYRFINVRVREKMSGKVNRYPDSVVDTLRNRYFIIDFEMILK